MGLPFLPGFFAGIGMLVLAGDSPEPRERRIEIRYEIRVRAEAPDHGKILAWVPLPLDDAWQKLESYRTENRSRWDLVNDPEFGNRFLRIDLTKTKDMTDTVILIVLRRSQADPEKNEVRTWAGDAVRARSITGLSIPRGRRGLGKGTQIWPEPEAGLLDLDRVAFIRGTEVKVPGPRAGILQTGVQPTVEAHGRPWEKVSWSWTWREIN